MAVCSQAKRVTDPLDDKAKARLRGYYPHQTMDACASSGSEHEPATCLSGLVRSFLESAGSPSTNTAAGPSSDGEVEFSRISGDDGVDRDSASAEIVRELMNRPADKDPFRLYLATDVSAVVEALKGLRQVAGAAAFRRAVMARLRAAGYNAGICKARWETSGGLTGGNYEYIDVVPPTGTISVNEEEGRRYIVDLEFAGEFEVARATEEYKRVLAALPRVAVERTETLQQVVRTIADATRRSLRAQDLHVPPWRKSRYMLAKWLGPYRRATNEVLCSAGADVPRAGSEIKWRDEGFPAPATGFVVAPATTRTR